jgi:hypothetical protein
MIILLFLLKAIRNRIANNKLNLIEQEANPPFPLNQACSIEHQGHQNLKPEELIKDKILKKNLM